MMHITNSLTLKPDDLKRIGYSQTGIDNGSQVVWRRGIHYVLVKDGKVFNVKL